MDLRDYLRMLQRGWLTVLAVAVVGALLGVLYLQVTAPVYQSSVAILAAPRNAQNLGDLQLGGQFAVSSAPTIATLVQSPAVLGPAAADIVASGSGGPEELSAADLAPRISVSAQESTSVITIVSTSNGAEQAALVANAVAESAVDVVPGLLSSDPRASGTPLLSLQTIGRGTVPGAPVSPDRGRVLTLTIVIGLALGLALTITRQSLDSRVLGVEDVRAVTSTKLLAVLPRRRRSKKTPVVVRDEPNSPSVEAYRVLRTNLGQPVSGAHRSIVFAPVAADEFSPRVPVNLAWSLAQTGRRVLLIDLDLRGARIAQLLGLPNETGAADLLDGPNDTRGAVRPTGQPGLDVITSGSSSRAPSDLLSGPELERMIRTAEREYDVVVLNLPPLLAYSDAAVVARAASETIVVVRAEETRLPELRAALEVLSNVGIAPLGLVLSGSKNSVTELSRLAPPPGRQPASAGRRAALSRRSAARSGS